MILTLTGASGTGKTTVAKRLYDRNPSAMPLISYTTREPRSTDLPGDYAFVSVPEFESMDRHGDFLWTAHVGETRYGTTKDSLRHALEDDTRIHLMILVPERVPNVHEFATSIGKSDQVKSFLFETPDEQTLRERMKGRGDAPESIDERIRDTGAFEKTAKSFDIPWMSVPDATLEEKVRIVIASVSP